MEHKKQKEFKPIYGVLKEKGKQLMTKTISYNTNNHKDIENSK